MKRKLLIISAIFCIGSLSFSTKAQSLGDLLNQNVLSNVVSKVTGSSPKIDLPGTWQYVGSAVQFDSNNLLKEAGGAIAAQTVEKKLDTQFQKVGIRQGITKITFNPDGTFSLSAGKTKTGTYTYDASRGEVTLKFANLVSRAAKVSSKGSNEMALLFNADQLLKVMSTVGKMSSNSTLSTISSLAGSYQGMEVGLSLKRQ